MHFSQREQPVVRWTRHCAGETYEDRFVCFGFFSAGSRRLGFLLYCLFPATPDPPACRPSRWPLWSSWRIERGRKPCTQNKRTLDKTLTNLQRTAVQKREPQTNPEQTSNGARADPERTPTGRRTDPERTPNGSRADPVFRPMLTTRAARPFQYNGIQKDQIVVLLLR